MIKSCMSTVDKLQTKEIPCIKILLRKSSFLYKVLVGSNYKILCNMQVLDLKLAY